MVRPRCRRRHFNLATEFAVGKQGDVDATVALNPFPRNQDAIPALSCRQSSGGADAMRNAATGLVGEVLDAPLWQMTISWREENWKVVFPEKKMFLMKEHNWAFIAWHLAMKNGWINESANLVHVDGHLDANSDSLRVPYLKEADTLEELSSLTKEEEGDFNFVGIDNFIFAGLAKNSIGKVSYVCPSKLDEQGGPFDLSYPIRAFDGITDVLTEEKISQYTNGYRFYSILEFQTFTKNSNFFMDNHSFILDLDLDVFIEEYWSDRLGANTFRLIEESEIRRQLLVLKAIYKWDCITVAISPYYCHSEENASKLLEIFNYIFEVNIDEGLPWCCINI
jgi:hypothetical protein